MKEDESGISITMNFGKRWITSCGRAVIDSGGGIHDWAKEQTPESLSKSTDYTGGS